MLSKLEKRGLLSILEEKIHEAADSRDLHYANYNMEDQSKEYRNIQYAKHQYYDGLVTGLQEAINEIKDIPVA